jgi:hypothetical protein
MTKNVPVRTPRLLKSIREDREPAVIQCAVRQVPFLIGGLGETAYKPVVPGKDGGRDGDGAEGIAEHLAEQCGSFARAVLR